MRGAILRLFRDDEDTDLVNDTISDAIESLWRSILLVNLGQFMGGPITNLTFAAGAERMTIVNVADPVAGPTVTTAAGGPLPNRTILYNLTYVTDSGSETNAFATPVMANVALNFLSTVAPPSYPNVPTGNPQPGNPLGYNVYASFDALAPTTPDPSNLRLQNSVPIPFNVKWQEPGTGVDMSGGLPPTSNTTADNIFYIRLMEVQNPDQTWTRWESGRIDDLLMQRMSSRIANTSSAYANYAYDFINGNTVEIRPAAGTTLNPRYFYVIKPRRLKYDRSQIPFPNLAHQEFIKQYALNILYRSVQEFTAASMALNASEKVRQEILEGLNTQQTSRQKNITPYFGR